MFLLFKPLLTSETFVLLLILFIKFMQIFLVFLVALRAAIYVPQNIFMIHVTWGCDCELKHTYI